MKVFEREFTDFNGKKVKVAVQLAEPGDRRFESAVQHLANRARGKHSRRAGAAGGLLQVLIMSDEREP